MKLIRFGAPQEEKPGVLREDGIRLDASRFGSDYDEEFFASGGLAALRAWFAKDGASAPQVPANVRWAPPVCRPSKIICVGLNYRDHAAETKAEVPKEPVLFFKATSSLVGPNDALVIPKNSTKVDWEVELAVVMEKRASYVNKEEGLEYVAGFVLHNDYSERAFQLERGGQWSKGKSADTFAPLGPFLATRDEVKNFRSLAMWLKVNGEFRQRGSTANMIFDVPTVVAYISQFMSLLPGDVISTGTPAGVALGMNPPVFLKSGDVIELGIEGLGESRQQAVNYQR
ncbi:MAG: fumarylacetoacetate hydrolase family protein [Candidatus Acidiferrum sp.]